MKKGKPKLLMLFISNFGFHNNLVPKQQIYTYIHKYVCLIKLIKVTDQLAWEVSVVC